MMRLHIASVAVVLTVAAGCSSASDPGPIFDSEGGQEITCMAHQPASPGARYTDVAQRNSAEALGLMRYYTANGAKPFCDGAAPTDDDRAWAKIYVDYGGAAAKAATALGAG